MASPRMRCMLIATGVAAALPTLVRGQAYQDVAPLRPQPVEKRPPATKAAPLGDSTRVAVSSLEGLVFVSAGTSLAGATAPARGVSAQGLPALDAAFLDGFQGDLGKPLTFARLAEIRRAVVDHYRSAGKPLVDVFVPEQDVSDGVVRIDVAEFRLGEVRVSGNRYFPDKLLIGEMPLEPGAPILQSSVSSGLALLNANPYRRVDVVFVPGAAANSTDVLLQTEDRLPFRVNAGYDNDGVPDLGRDRIFAGINYGNLFGLDQQIAYQFTASNDIVSGNPELEARPNRARFTAHALNYVAPLPWLDRIELFGVYAESTPRLPDPYGQTGISAQASFRYDWRLAPGRDWHHQVQFGYDFKQSNNDLEFGGFQVFNSSTHVHQFLVGYDFALTSDVSSAHVNVTLIGSPGGLDGKNSDTAYATVRQGATARYAYLRLAGQGSLALGAGFALNARSLVQWTPNTLLPSEEMGLGGESSVRGYDPYVVLGDRGWNIQTELRTPAVEIGKSDAAAQPFIFVDAGHVWNRIDQPAESHSGALVSVGAGVRFQWSRYVEFRGIYGIPLRTPAAGRTKAPMFLLFVSVGT